jgi:glycosyltransferase involved in cell wall biosynthesis
MSMDKNSNSFSATVIIAFYNKVRFLELVLAGLSRQSIKNFEVIIADDGSKEENVAAIKKIFPKFSFPIKHLWHEDNGFRKNIMLNKCILEAQSNVLIFVDGDCIPHKNFVEEHLQSTKVGFCSTGRRVNLSHRISEILTPELVAAGYLESIPTNISMFMDAFKGDGNHSGQGIYFQNSLLRKIINQKTRGVLGSNFSATKTDLLAINGFDERYVHPSVGEDTDIEYRLHLHGVKTLPLINVAVQYHMFHKELPREKVNFELFEETKRRGTAKTPFGIKKL